LVLVGAWSAVLSATSGAAAAPSAGSGGTFSVVPVAPAGGLSYFRFDLAPGGVAHGAVTVIGGPTGTAQVHVFPARGVTAIGSGDAYLAPTKGTCADPGCWITGLPDQLTVAANERHDVTFTVQVPAGTPPGEYLAGVGVAGVAPSATSTSQSTKGRSAESHIDRQVVVGVEVTVGSGYPDTLRIKKVTGTSIGSSPGIVLDEENTGSTIEHPTGAVTVGTGSKAHTFSSVSGTILAGGHAGLRVPTPGVQPGVYPASAYLHYDNGQKVARWAGTVRISSPPPSKSVTVPAGGRVVVVSTGWPTWLTALLVAVGLLLLVACLLMVRTLRTRRKAESHE
jgi:hypothetical protein